MRNAPLLFSTLSSVCLLFSAAAGATTIHTLYSEPLITGSSAPAAQQSSGTQQIADNFSIATGGLITTITFDGYGSGTTAQTFNLDFYSTSGNLPGTLLSSQSALITPVDTGSNANGNEIYLYTVSLTNDPFAAGSGTEYWFSTYDTTGTFDWAAGTPPGGTKDARSTSGGAYSLVTGKPAFGFTGLFTPEPSSLLLGATGLIGIAGSARRRLVRG